MTPHAPGRSHRFGAIQRLLYSGDPLMKATYSRCLIALAMTAAAFSASYTSVRAFDCRGCPPCGNRTGLYGCHCFSDCRGTCAYGTCCSGCGDCNPCGGPIGASWRPSITTDCWPGLTYSYACNTSRGYVDGCDCGSSYSGYASEYAAPVEYSAPAPSHAAPSSCGCSGHASATRAPSGYRVVRQRSAVQQAQLVQQGSMTQHGQRGRMPSQHRTVSGYSRRVTR
jgi:hypothetical protein